MILLLLTIIPLLAGCDDKSVCDDGLCIWYENNVTKTDDKIEPNINPKYRYTISVQEAKAYRTITYEDGTELEKSSCIPIPAYKEESPDDSVINENLTIKTAGMAIGTEIYASVVLYSDNNCKTKIRELSTNSLTISKKSNAVGPYKYSDGTVSVCPNSKGCISELSGYTSQTTSTNCHATAKDYINGIAAAIGGDFSSSNYTKQLYKSELGDDASTNLVTILAKIKSEIDAGRPVLARVYRPTRDKDSSTTQESTTHSVTVVAYKNSGTKMSDFIIVDPWGDVRGGSLVSCTLNRGTYMGNYDYRFCSMQYSGQESKCSDTYSIMAYSS